MAEQYDLVITGGRIIDPANNIDGLNDVAVTDGKIAAIAENLPTDTAETIDAAGKLVIPGMIDTHAHVYEHVSGRFGMNPDLVGVRSGVTTVIDQGGPSCMTFPGFRNFIAKPAKTNVLAFISIYTVGGLEGHYYPYLYGPGGVDAAACAKAAAANSDIVKGIKAHAEPGGISRWGLETLELAKDASREAGIPVYIHLGELWPTEGGVHVDMDERLPEIVALIEEGDILAHPFTRHPGGFVNKEGKLHPIVNEAIDKGVLIDIGHGSHFSFEMARAVLDAGVLPTTVGADMHGYNTHVPAEAGTPDDHPDDEMHLFAGQARFSMCHAMTELMAMGVKMEDTIPMVSSSCAEMIGMGDELGTLGIGRTADISVLHDETGEWTLHDNSDVEVTTNRRLRPAFCIRAGEYFDADAPILPE
ncbi:MAG: amidohydrolase/deacetylase family metallohydrolase [Alphaproteobacteria bacterium]|nr:amidohydrolase/deacetylase family metallohydrolase [Alphaproteobacteria bacterium]